MPRLWQAPSGLALGTRRRVGPLHGERETLIARREIMSTLFDQAQRICRGDSLPPPVARLIGFTLTSIAPGHARIAFEAGAQHANPIGTLHGAPRAHNRPTRQPTASVAEDTPCDCHTPAASGTLFTRNVRRQDAYRIAWPQS